MQEYKDEVRKKIVEAAYSLFLDKGYHATTMSSIAESLGVSKPAIYQYFPGKEELYAAVAEHGREELASILERSFNNRDLRSGSEVLLYPYPVYTPVQQHFDDVLRFIMTDPELLEAGRGYPSR
jgi:AcrR family transcriptional regulator